MDKKKGLLGSIVHILAKVLLICTKYSHVEWF